MHELLVVGLTILAVHRLTILVTNDRILERLRTALQTALETDWCRRTGYPLEEAQKSDTWLSPGAYLLSCPWCMSIWIAAVFVPTVDLTIGLPAPVLVWLAASGVTGVLASITGTE